MATSGQTVALGTGQEGRAREARLPQPTAGYKLTRIAEVWFTRAAATLLQPPGTTYPSRGIVSELSQYPHEAEILSPPLLGIEVEGHSVNDGRVVLDTRLSRNLMSETIEQVLQRRHKMIRELCDSVIFELLQKSGRLEPGPANELAHPAFRCGP